MTLKEIFNMGIGPSEELEKIIDICEKNSDYCLIGGLALNSYIEPVFTADADFVISADNIDQLKDAFKKAGFKFKKNRYDIEISFPESALKVHLTYDERYRDFAKNAKPGKLFNEIDVKIADIKDLIKGKSWAFADPARKFSKRTKDKLDLIRIHEEIPLVRGLLPDEILEEIEKQTVKIIREDPLDLKKKTSLKI